MVPPPTQNPGQEKSHGFEIAVHELKSAVKAMQNHLDAPVEHTGFDLPRRREAKRDDLRHDRLNVGTRTRLKTASNSSGCEI